MKTKFLPIGSVVYFEDQDKTYMIVARAMYAKADNEMKPYDYAACMYPEGLVNSQLLYFNHDNIDKIIFQGYINEDEIELSEFIIQRSDGLLSKDFITSNNKDLDW